MGARDICARDICARDIAVLQTKFSYPLIT